MRFANAIILYVAAAMARRPFVPPTNKRGACVDIQEKSLHSQPARANSIVEAYAHAWKGYHQYAFPLDELKPLSKSGSNTRYGWGLTVVDGIDTAIVMGLTDVVEQQLQFIDQLNFTLPYPLQAEGKDNHKAVSSFETNIRYLGGLLGANDLTNGSYPILLEKAIEVADMIYASFDTRYRIPQSRWEWTR